MISLRRVAIALSAVLCATPMLAQATDVQIRVNASLVYQDEQSGFDPSSSADWDLGMGVGNVTAYSGFVQTGSLPPRYETGAEITLTAMTVDFIEAQTFADRNQQWSFTDTDVDRVGAIQLRARFDLDWNLDFNVSTSIFAESYLRYDKFDADFNLQVSLGYFSCSSSGGAPSCSGSGFDLSDLNVVFNGMSYDITGPVYLPFTDGMVNSEDNWFGLSTGTYVSMNGGMAGEYLKYGAGNHVDVQLTSTEGSVTVVAVPEPALAGLQAAALIVLAGIGRRVQRAA